MAKRPKVGGAKAIEVDGSKKIAFTKFFFATQPGSVLGTACGGCPVETQFVWMDNIGPSVFDGLIRYGNKSLRDAGYDVMFPRNLLFGDEKVHHARYILGAWISGVEIDTNYRIRSLSGGQRARRVLDRGRAQLDISWQVYDTFTEKIVYRHKTVGVYAAKKPEVGLVLGAFTRALRELLATPDFAKAMAKEKTAAVWPKVLPHAVCRAKPKALPAGLEQTLNAVVTVRVGSSHGSGFVVSPDGHLLTAAHVVRGTDEALVRFRDGKQLIAKVVRTDGLRDAAVLKVESEEASGKRLACLPLAKAAPKLGSDVFVVGAPTREELSFSVSIGILSGRQVIDDKPFLQTDASVNPGNSGGPILNARGEATAIVSWKISGIGVEGLGFGVPIGDANKALGLTPKGR